MPYQKVVIEVKCSYSRSDEGYQTDIKKRHCILLYHFCPVFASHSAHCLIFLPESLSVTYHLFLVHLPPNTFTPLIISKAKKDLLFSLSFVPIHLVFSNFSPWTLSFPTPHHSYLACRLKISPSHL